MVPGLGQTKDSTVSHAAIMARSMGILAVVQLRRHGGYGWATVRS